MEAAPHTSLRPHAYGAIQTHVEPPCAWRGWENGDTPAGARGPAGHLRGHQTFPKRERAGDQRKSQHMASRPTEGTRVVGRSGQGASASVGEERLVLGRSVTEGTPAAVGRQELREHTEGDEPEGGPGSRWT